MDNIKIVKQKANTIKTPSINIKRMPFKPIKEVPVVVEKKKTLNLPKSIYTKK